MIPKPFSSDAVSASIAPSAALGIPQRDSNILARGSVLASAARPQPRRGEPAPAAIQHPASRMLSHDPDRLHGAGLRAVKLAKQPLSLRLDDQQIRQIRTQVMQLLAKHRDRATRCIQCTPSVSGPQRRLRPQRQAANATQDT